MDALNQRGSSLWWFSSKPRKRWEKVLRVADEVIGQRPRGIDSSSRGAWGGGWDKAVIHVVDEEQTSAKVLGLPKSPTINVQEIGESHTSTRLTTINLPGPFEVGDFFSSHVPLFPSSPPFSVQFALKKPVTFLSFMDSPSSWLYTKSEGDL